MCYNTNDNDIYRYYIKYYRTKNRRCELSYMTTNKDILFQDIRQSIQQLSYNIIAIWQNQELSQKYNILFLNIVIDDTEPTNLNIIDYNINTTLIPIETKHNIIINSFVSKKKNSYPTTNVEEKDFIIRKNNYEKDNNTGVLPFNDEDTINEEKYIWHKKLMSFFNEQPKYYKILQQNTQIIIPDENLMNTDNSWNVHSLWTYMIINYPLSLMMKFINSGTPKVKEMITSSPFITEDILELVDTHLCSDKIPNIE